MADLCETVAATCLAQQSPSAVSETAQRDPFLRWQELEEGTNCHDLHGFFG